MIALIPTPHEPAVSFVSKIFKSTWALALGGALLVMWLAFCGVVVGLGMFGVGVAEGLGLTSEPPMDVISLALYAPACVLASFAIVWIGRRYGYTVKSVFGKLPSAGETGRHLALVIPLLLVSLGLGFLWLSGLEMVSPGATDEMTAHNQLNSANGQGIVAWVLLFIVMVVGAPLGEELFFRGVLYRRLREKGGFWLALVASAVAFGILHPMNVIGITVVGIMMAVVYHKTRSLWLPIAMHALNNLICFGFILGSSLVGDTGEFSSETVTSVGMLAAAVGLIVVGLPWLIYYAINKKPAVVEAELVPAVEAVPAVEGVETTIAA